MTRRVFWDLAVYMVGLGVGVGLVFPPFATGLGVPARYATRPSFEVACLVAGFLVGALSYAVCRWLVGGRLAVLSTHLRSVAESISSASRTGDWSGSTSDRIAVDSDDQLGETARAFNSLLGDPAVGGIVLTTRDVSDRKELEERLRTQAFYDPLTALPNRALFMERLRAAEEGGRAAGTALAVIFLDLDDLKAVNDDLGHESGDALLQVVTARVRGCVRAQDTVARLAGDEFAVLVTGPDSAGHAERVATRILASLRQPVHLLDRSLHAGASLGIATTATSAASGLGLLRAADVAMYIAKTTGKGRCEVFQPAHHAAQLARERLLADLHRALDAQELVLHHQPIVDLGSGDVVGFEALLRWQHPERGLVPPAEFIALAEDSGLIVPIGRWVLHEATRQAAAWQRPGGHRPLRMSVNVSVRQFQHPDLVRDVADALRDSRLDARLLTLEITETLFAHDTDDTVRKLEELKELGVHLALDDFGTGYSSLSYLRRFPVDALKIDKSFIDGVASSAQDRAVVGAIIQLGQTLQLEVIAEGLEDVEQVHALALLSCPLGQGYHFSRPLAPPDAWALVRGAAPSAAALIG